jgi:hypothetical protein
MAAVADIKPVGVVRTASRMMTMRVVVLTAALATLASRAGPPKMSLPAGACVGTARPFRSVYGHGCQPT